MTAPFILVKPYKSAGIAILLTILFGPIGLFYASVTAGITMTVLVPIVLILITLLAAYADVALLEYTVIAVLVVCIFYWLICLIYAVTAVQAYNRKIEEEYERQQRIHNETNQSLQFKPSFQKLDNYNQDNFTNTHKPNMQDWMKENPGKGINDYFMKFVK